MGPFFDAILAPSNLWLTVLLGLCCLYWLIVVVGGLSVDTLDVDLDVDAGVDVDVDGALNGAAGAAGGLDAGDAADLAPVDAPPSLGMIGLTTAMLRFLNLGEVPLMIVLSVIVTAMWAIKIILHPVTTEWGLAAQGLALFPIFLAAVVVMKVATWPVKSLFRKMREEEQRHSEFQLVGKICRISSSEVTPTVGVAEYATGGAPIVLNVRSKGDDVLRRGQEVVIIGRDERNGTYFVRPF